MDEEQIRRQIEVEQAIERFERARRQELESEISKELDKQFGWSVADLVNDWVERNNLKKDR